MLSALFQTTTFGAKTEEFDMSPFSLSAMIEEIVINEIEEGSDLSVSDVGRRGIGSQCSIELKDEKTTITSPEDFDKPWLKSIVHEIKFLRRKTVFVKTNQRFKPTIDSFVKGLKIPTRFNDLELYQNEPIERNHNRARTLNVANAPSSALFILRESLS